MSQALKILGGLFLLLGVITAALCFGMSGQMQVWSISPDTAVLLLVGGSLCLGLSGVVAKLEHLIAINLSCESALQEQAFSTRGEVAAKSSPPPKAEAKSATRQQTAAQHATALQMETMPASAGLARGAAATATLAGLQETTTSALAKVGSGFTQTTSASDTIKELEKAKMDIAAALGIETATARPSEELTAVEEEVLYEEIEEELEQEEELELEEELAKDLAEKERLNEEEQLTELDETESETETETELYVVEERVIRGRPARVLSDGTVEAETDEGWMRFENLEHLHEYLEAMVPSV